MLRSIVTQLPFFLCLFWALFFFLQPKEKGASKQILGLFMFFSSLMHLSYCVFFSRDVELYVHFEWLFLLTTLLIIPTFFLYLVSTSKSSIHSFVSFVHYLPAITYLIVYLIIFGSSTLAVKYQYLNILMYSAHKIKLDFSNPAHQLSVLFVINRFIFMAQTVFYAVLSIKVIRAYRKRLKNVYSNTEGRELTWLNSISVCIILLVVSSAFFNTVGRKLFSSSDILLAVPSLFYASILFYIGLIGSRVNFSVLDLELEEKKLQELEYKDNVEMPSSIRQRLDQIMNEKQLFLTSDLRITALCKELNTNRTYLSQVLNDELHENFNSYVNKHRVNYAISLLKSEENKQSSLDQISELSGFGSSVSMLRAFKQTAGKTPSEYRK